MCYPFLSWFGLLVHAIEASGTAALFFICFVPPADAWHFFLLYPLWLLALSGYTGLHNREGDVESDLLSEFTLVVGLSPAFYSFLFYLIYVPILFYPFYWKNSLSTCMGQIVPALSRPFGLPIPVFVFMHW